MAEIDIKALVWNDINITHIWERHHLTKEVVEDACFYSPDLIKLEDAHTGRVRIIAPRSNGLLLVVILASEREDTCYVVTAKPPKRQEIRRYQQWKAEKERSTP